MVLELENFLAVNIFFQQLFYEVLVTPLSILMSQFYTQLAIQSLFLLGQTSSGHDAVEMESRRDAKLLFVFLFIHTKFVSILISFVSFVKRIYVNFISFIVHTY